MQKYIKLSEIQAALLNEKFSLNTTNGQMTVKVLDIVSYHEYSKAFLGYDNHKHEIVVKLTNKKRKSKKAVITVIESYENLSCGRDNLRNSREIKNLTDSIVKAIDTYVSQSYHAGGVKSLLRQSAFDHNDK